MDVTVIRSRRKTISVEVRPDGIIARAPRWVPRYEIDRFIEKQSAWIERQKKKLAQAAAEFDSVEPITEAELKVLSAQAKRVIPERVRYYAPLVGVDYGRVTIRAQRTRWGSCSVKGNLNFNCLLMLTPPEVLDSVVVHELCHRRHMNHSAAFYAEIERVYPEYRKWNRWLKKNGRALLLRLEKGRT